MSSEDVYMVYTVDEPFSKNDDHWSDKVFIKAVTYDEKEARALTKMFSDYRYVHTTDTSVERISSGDYEYLDYWDSLDEFETYCKKKPYHIRIDIWRYKALSSDDVEEELKPLLDLVRQHHNNIKIERQC